MKIYLSVFCLFYVNFILSQIKSGEVTFNTKNNYISSNENKTHPNFKESKSRIQNAITELEFVLKFNLTESLFEIKKELVIEETDFYKNMALFATRGNKLFYSNSSEKLISEQFSFLGKKLIIKHKYDELNWILTKENKKIKNYSCYKAYRTVEINKIPENKKINYTYIAWYCPELNFNFGPFESSGLPGLVLEFSNDKIIYFANTITLKKDSKLIKKPTKGQVVTKKEFENIGKKAFESANN